MIFIFGDASLGDFFRTKASETWEAQQAKTKEIMIRDVIKSIELDREKTRQNPNLELFSFEDLVRSAKKTIWLDESDVRLICAEALFRLLPKEDYRHGNWNLYIEDIFK